MRRSVIDVGREKLTDKYRLLGKIGEGTYGIVYKAEKIKTNTNLSCIPSSPYNELSNNNDNIYAVKVVKPHKEGNNIVVLSLATIREVKLLRELHHNNVVHLHHVHIHPTEQTLALIFDFAEHDLRHIILQSKNNPLPEFTVKSLMYQILKGIHYIHQHSIMHRDLKPQNILVVGSGKGKGMIKIADFGLARIFKKPLKSLSDVDRVVVTLWYRAPELLFGVKHYTKAIDMWSVGCIFVELLNNRELFCGREVEGNDNPFQKDQIDKIFRILGNPIKTCHSMNYKNLDLFAESSNIKQMLKERNYPEQSELKNVIRLPSGKKGLLLYDLIAKLLDYDPDKRLTAQDALEHPYFTDMDPLPRDSAFDEPSREPLVFQGHKIEPILDDKFLYNNKNVIQNNNIDNNYNNNEFIGHTILTPSGNG